MKCPECLFINDHEIKKCVACGYRFKEQGGSSEMKEDFVWQYFGFRKLITPALIKLSHLVGVVAITIVSSFAIVSPDTFTAFGGDSTRVMFMGILVLVLGNLVWRMLCEGAMLLFSLHEILVSLEDTAELLAAHAEQQHSS
jgi:hypothetical protein